MIRAEQRQQYVIYEFNVTENALPSLVGRIPGNDVTDDVEYAVFDPSRLPNTLNLTTNGEIYTRQPLDREIAHVIRLIF